MIRRKPRSPRPDTVVPYTTLGRALHDNRLGEGGKAAQHKRASEKWDGNSPMNSRTKRRARAWKRALDRAACGGHLPGDCSPSRPLGDTTEEQEHSCVR